MGHLVKGSSHQVEFEADAFAWKTQQSLYDHNPSISFWYQLGGLSLLTVLALIEIILNIGQSRTHPSAKSRIQAILNQLDDDLSLDFLLYLEGILTVCEGTIAHSFGIQYRTRSR